jgi:hypothetical protein
LAALSHLGFFFCCQCDQFFFGDYAVFVGVGFIEKPKQTGIGHLIPGEFAIVFLVEGHHSRNDGRVAVVLCRRTIVGTSLRGLCSRLRKQAHSTDDRSRKDCNASHEIISKMMLSF